MREMIIGGRYELRDFLGRGAHAVVMEAIDRRLSRLVALKILPYGADEQGTELLARFEQEARAVARLSHPGIVPVHDVGQGPDYAWLAMELVIGGTLEDVLRQTPRPPPGEAVRIAVELLDALALAHRRGVVHRDVKPANILLVDSFEGGLGRARLTDFGVAHFPQSHRSGLTSNGQLIGTPSTMAPEQLRGETPDPRVDIWAAGVVLYRMLTGRRPFAGNNVYATMHAIHNFDPPPPSQLVPELPQVLDGILARALCKDPAGRFQQAAEMASALRAVPLVADEDAIIAMVA